MNMIIFMRTFNEYDNFLWFYLRFIFTRENCTYVLKELDEVITKLNLTNRLY